MSDLNSEILQWVRLAKGDVQGHPFHGNQHVSAQQVADAKQTATSAKHLAIAAREGVENPRQGRLTPDGTYVKGFSERELRRLGALHASAEMEHRQMAEDTTGMVSRMHDQAAVAHAIASDTAYKEAEKVKNDPYSTDSQMHVALASENASGQSDKALSATKSDFNKGEKSAGVVKATDGRYTEIIEWLSLYKDFFGHVFHGNQHTGGEGGAPADPNRFHVSPDRFQPEEQARTVVGMSRTLNKHSTPEQMRVVASAHKDMADLHASRGEKDAAHAHSLAAFQFEQAAKSKEAGDSEALSNLYGARANSLKALTSTMNTVSKAVDSGRYTEITVSKPNLTDWQHQGWNGPGKDGVLDGDDSSDESSSENMYGEDL